jgi:hypothetical protein
MIATDYQLWRPSFASAFFAGSTKHVRGSTNSASEFFPSAWQVRAPDMFVLVFCPINNWS